MPTDVDVVVIGAGISGLTAAYRIQQQGLKVAVLEARSRAGGVIGTCQRDGFLYETGPNSTLDSTPLFKILLADLGIADQRRDAGAAAATRFVVRDGKLMPLPTSPGEFLASDTFSSGAKLRLLREPFIARSPADADESIAEFARRRLGREFLDYGVDPFVAGIYAGDPERLSVPAAFPRLFALEQKHGSLIKGQISGARERKRDSASAPALARSFSFAGGMQTLTDALAANLVSVEFDAQVARIVRNKDSTFTVEGLAGGAAFARRALAVVLAVPAGAAGELMRPLAAGAAQALLAIEYAPVAIAASAYRRTDVADALAGFGFLVPKRERRRILGALFSSSMYAGRAPEGSVLVTTFLGGRRNPDAPTKTDAEIAGLVHEELGSLIGAKAQPLWTQIVRWPQAIPQYDLGHLGRIGTADAAAKALPGLYLCASYRGGVAVGDCVKSAHATAQAVARHVETAAHRR